MSDLDTQLTTRETIKAMLDAGHEITLRRAEDGCYEAERKAGKFTEVCHAATLDEAVADVATGILPY